MTTIENLVVSSWSNVGTFIKSQFKNKKLQIYEFLLGSSLFLKLEHSRFLKSLNPGTALYLIIKAKKNLKIVKIPRIISKKPIILKYFYLLSNKTLTQYQICFIGIKYFLYHIFFS